MIEHRFLEGDAKETNLPLMGTPEIHSLEFIRLEPLSANFGLLLV